ncbi:MAG: hypothetical protein ABI693_08815 [Bryobacteraceae bacterium]
MAAKTGWLGRLLVPSFSDVFFAAVVMWLFMAGSGGWSFLLLDGDCGWHIKTGELVLQNGDVPRTDPYSFTKQGEQWFAWEWLADVAFALVHRAMGLKGVVLLAAVLIGAFATVLLRQVLAAGSNLFIGLLGTLLAVGASTIHHLARPHLFTLVLLPCSLWLIQADRERPSHRVWILVPITAVWCNLHGGFVALLACLGLAVVGSAGEGIAGAPEAWKRCRRYLLLIVACGAASLANPYGYQLHVHIAEYLRAGWIRELVQEFQSPDFRSESLFQFEMVLFGGLAAAAWLAAKKRYVEVLWVLFWAHSALGSVRHVPLFAAVAIPIVCRELSRVWRRWLEGAATGTSLASLRALERAQTGAFLRTSMWPAGFVLIVASLGFGMTWPKDFPEAKFPARSVAAYGGLLRRSRVLTSDQWADYLIYRGYPEQRVFLDGRSDFFGERLVREYAAVTAGRYDWQKILERHGIDVILAPAGWPLATLLKGHSEWQLLRDDGQAVLFQRTTTETGVPLIKVGVEAERVSEDRIQ